MNRLNLLDRGLVALWVLNTALACVTENWMGAMASAACAVLVLTRETRR